MLLSRMSSVMMSVTVILIVTAVLQEISGYLVYPDFPHCPGNSVLYKCYPNSPYFTWSISHSTESVGLAFANRPNGTSKVDQIRSVTLRSTIIYDSDGRLCSSLTFLAHPNLHGATISCDQDSAIFSIATLIHPLLILSKENMSKCFETILNEEFSRYTLNYLVEVMSPNEQPNSTILCNLSSDILHNFTVTNKNCPDSSPPAPTFIYKMGCQLIQKSTYQVPFQYGISYEGNMSTTIKCASGELVVMDCDSLQKRWWPRNNVCPTTITFPTDMLEGDSVTGARKNTTYIENKTELQLNHFSSVRVYLISVGTSFIVCLIMFTLLLVFIGGSKFQKHRKWKKKVLTVPHNSTGLKVDQDMLSSETSSDHIYECIIAEGHVCLSKNEAYDDIKSVRDW